MSIQYTVAILIYMLSSLVQRAYVYVLCVMQKFVLGPYVYLYFLLKYVIPKQVIGHSAYVYVSFLWLMSICVQRPLQPRLS